jgi:hypothetical protein
VHLRSRTFIASVRFGGLSEHRRTVETGAEGDCCLLVSPVQKQPLLMRNLARRKKGSKFSSTAFVTNTRTVVRSKPARPTSIDPGIEIWQAPTLLSGRPALADLAGSERRHSLALHIRNDADGSAFEAGNVEAVLEHRVAPDLCGVVHSDCVNDTSARGAAIG